MRSAIFLLMGLVILAGCADNGEVVSMEEESGIVMQYDDTETPTETEVITEETFEGITREQIAENNNANSCWVAWRGEVYDLTGWLRDHPGGADAITPNCGTVEQFEEAFQERHNSGGTRDDGLLRNEPIGVLVN